jgi:hypothetical protein
MEVDVVVVVVADGVVVTCDGESCSGLGSQSSISGSVVGEIEM